MYCTVSGSNETVCEECDAGTYSSSGASSSCDFTNTTCPTGTYAVAPSSCESCPTFVWSPVGSTNVSACSSGSLYLPSRTPFLYYSAIDTDYARRYTIDQTFTGCAGYTMKFSSCSVDGGSASGYYNNLRLYNAAGSEIAVGGYGIGLYCSNGAYFTYTFTEACQTYTLKQGCKDSDSCVGQVAISLIGKPVEIYVMIRTRIQIICNDVYNLTFWYCSIAQGHMSIYI
jgi:hypothetical protein